MLAHLIHNIFRGSKLSGAVRQALALCGELDEDDPYYRARRGATSPQYDDIDDDHEYVVVLQRRHKRQPPRRVVGDEEYAWRASRASRRTPVYDEDDEILFTQQQTQKRELDEDNSLGYSMPVSRRYDFFDIYILYLATILVISIWFTFFHWRNLEFWIFGL